MSGGGVAAVHRSSAPFRFRRPCNARAAPEIAAWLAASAGGGHTRFLLVCSRPVHLLCVSQFFFPLLRPSLVTLLLRPTPSSPPISASSSLSLSPLHLAFGVCAWRFLYFSAIRRDGRQYRLGSFFFHHSRVMGRRRDTNSAAAAAEELPKLDETQRKPLSLSFPSRFWTFR